MNQVRTVTARGIKAVVKAINTHIDSAGICYNGCGVLWNISEGNASLQKEVCEKEGLEILLRVLNERSNNKGVSGMLCAAIGTTLSSPETYAKYCTPEVIRVVEECCEKHKDSEKIKQFLLSLKREEDPRVCDAVARGVCTKEVFPKCSENCGCNRGCYHCPMCCVQQKAFRCLTCDKDGDWMYCEVCWKRDHQGHKGEEFFCPVRCATGYKDDEDDDNEDGHFYNLY